MLTKLNAELRLVSQRQNLKALISGENVDAWFAYQSATSNEKEALLTAITTAISTFTSDIDDICAKSDSLVYGDVAVLCLQRHRAALARLGGERLVKALASIRQRLITAYTSGGKLQAAIDDTRN
ncbi:hypothetical protein ACHHYP_20436 [Achlya hypogyna]|uniref:Uncharacterized protein n=1 Tax=Achlya hypogyna TaxID=1202772 RepID=A0A1V9YMN9_ACHHY|nr:hypothetical protein ACHHYP_20436 [Achlya hypogyna]